ncbi:MAG: hypothetical protein ACQESR_01560 [Planctomycetota bacterium]
MESGSTQAVLPLVGLVADKGVRDRYIHRDAEPRRMPGQPKRGGGGRNVYPRNGNRSR